MAGKKYRQLKEKMSTQIVDLASAVALLKQNPSAKFDETVEVHINLGVDHEKSDQMVRGSLTLPSGSPRQKKIAVFTTDAAQQKAATEAGAAIVGGKELVEEIAAKGNLDADVTVAQPNMMPEIAKVAKILGPKGLMPNPKTGTVTPDPASVVKELLAGKVAFKMDQLGNIHEAVAKLSWPEEKISANIKAVIEAVATTRPATARGQFLRKIVVKSTMSPAIQIQW